MTDRDSLIFNAKLAEQAERYEEMVKYMKEVAQMDSELSVEERNLLSVAYKNVIGARRASWRIISSIESKDISRDAKEYRKQVNKEFREKVEVELNDICKELIKLIDDYLFGKADKPEYKVFFLKMKGDYYRYLSEISMKEKQTDTSDKSLKAYEDATTEARPLPATNPIRLGLALNFSVFYYEILNNPEKACELAKKAFDEAITELDNLPEESYKDSTLIMQLLRDNLTLWNSEANQDDGGNGDANNDEATAVARDEDGAANGGAAAE